MAPPKTTKLVIVFNQKRLLQGALTAAIAIILAVILPIYALKIALAIFAGLILLNMLAALLASYLLFDHSDLFQLRHWPQQHVPPQPQAGMLVHASFDPISRMIEAQYPQMQFAVYNIFGNRHEKDRGVAISNRIFPPHPREQVIDPTALPLPDASLDVIFGVTAIHELLQHEQRVKFFREARRTLRPGGRLILIEQMRTPINFLFFNVGAFHFLPPSEWRSCIQKGGLAIASQENITPWGSLWVLQPQPA